MSVPRTSGLPAGVTKTRFTTSSGPLAALQTGAGQPAVLLVPGFTGSKEDFSPLLPLLAAAGFESASIDLRGQYESAAGEDRDLYTRDALAADVGELIDSLGNPHLVAHSYGGIVSRAAVIAGARPNTLTLLGSGPAGLQGKRRSIMEFIAPILDQGGVPAVWEANEAVNAERPDIEVASPEVKAFLRERFLASPEAALRQMAEDLLGEPDRVDELVACGVRTLIAHGELDDAWPPDVQAEMARRLGSAYEIIPDSLHSPAVENPEGTAKVLLKFWADPTA